MFRDLSFKKVAIACGIILVLISLVFYTYAKEKDYLEGFRISYYSSSLWNNIFNIRKYRGELSDGKSPSFLATLLHIFSPSESFTIIPPGQASSVPVLLYHGIVDEPDGQNITKNKFKEHLIGLKKAGYNTVGVSDLQAFLEGKIELPPKTIVLTFDDGRKDSFYPVDPILEALGFKAVMFVITKSSLGPANLHSSFYLTEWELRQMIKSGRWEVQSHGKEAHSLIPTDGRGGEGYFYGNKLWKDDQNRLETEAEFETRVKADLVDSKREIEDNFEIPVLGFAFPFGEFGQETINFPGVRPVLLNIIAPIYPITFQQVRGESDFKENYPLKDQTFVRRIEVEPEWSAETLVDFLEKSAGKPLPYSDPLEKDSGWLRSWGTFEIKKDALVISANPLTTGAFVVLDGTYAWKNYYFSANVVPESDSVFALVARYKDSANYLICKFENNHIMIEEVIAGVRSDLAVAENRALTLGQNSEIGIRVSGRSAGCFKEGVPLVETNSLHPDLQKGGVGFTIWDRKLDTAALKVEKVKVSTE